MSLSPCWPSPQEYSEQAGGGSKGPGSHIKHKAMKKLVALVDRSLDLFEGSLADDVFEGLISQVGMKNGDDVWELRFFFKSF